MQKYYPAGFRMYLRGLGFRDILPQQRASNGNDTGKGLGCKVQGDLHPCAKR